MMRTTTAFFRRRYCKALPIPCGAGVVLLLILLFAACSGSDDERTPQPSEPGAILFGSSKEGGIEWVNGRAGTRTGTPVESETPQNIGVFAFGDGQNTTYIFKNKKVYHENSSEYMTPTAKFAWPHHDLSHWPYTEDQDEVASVQRIWEKMHYRFFAYSPWHPDDHVSVSAENYAGFNTFTWDFIPGFSAFDYVLANEIIDVDNTGETMTTADVVHFRMRHILSRIRFFIKMDEHYRTIRKIELNSITVLTAGRVKTATFNFNNSLEWDETVHWSNEQPGTADPVTLTSADGQPYYILTDYDDYPKDSEGKPLPFNSIYVYPQDNFNEIRLTCDYTVYDSAGVVTRNAKITNIISLPNWTLLSGYYYDIRINIVPDYLYVLSDNDQDFDGWVVIKDSR